MLINNKDFQVQTFWDEKCIDEIKKQNVNRKISFVNWDNDGKKIANQLQYAIQNDVEKIYSDLLPDELPHHIMPYEYVFFLRKSTWIINLW